MEEHNNLKNIYSSALSAGIAELATLPICTLKTKYQNNNQNLNIRYLALQMYKQEGIPSFYRGCLPAVVSQSLSTSSKFVLYRHINNSYIENKFLAGLVSGVCATLFTHPVDTFKIHWQMNDPFLYRATRDPKLLYRGYSKTLFKYSLGSMLYLPIYDTVMDRTKNPALSSFVSAITSTIILQPVDYLKIRHIYGQDLYKQSNFSKGLSLNLLRVVPHFMITMVIIEKVKYLF